MDVVSSALRKSVRSTFDHKTFKVFIFALFSNFIICLFEISDKVKEMDDQMSATEKASRDMGCLKACIFKESGYVSFPKFIQNKNCIKLLAPTIESYMAFL